jgi:Protein of unknown function (DUF2919)
MAESYAPQLYPLSYYDQHMCLKPPLFLWLAALYLSKAITLPAVMGIGAFAGVNSAAIALFHQFWSVYQLAPSLIAFCVFVALVRRAPNASKPLRWIWSHGRLLLSLSAAIDLVMSLVIPIWQGEVNQQAVLSFCAAGIDAYFLLYILVARRVRDVFAEFPAPVAPVAPSAGT